MPWFKVDDKFHSHPKVMELSTGAIGLWTLAGTWCADYLTDGEIRRGQIRRLGGTEAEAAELLGAGLWSETEDGYRFENWHDYQPTRESVEGEREAARGRQRKRREQREKNKRDKPNVTASSQRDTHVTHTPVTDEFVTPVPEPVPEVPNGTSPSGGQAAAAVETSTAQALIGEWIDACQDRPPGRVIGQLSKEIKGLLDEGHEYQQVRAAVQEWNRKGMHPTTLPSVLHETRNKRPTQQQFQSASERRYAQGMNLVANELREQQEQLARGEITS